MGLEPGVAEWKMQTNTLSYDGTPKYQKNLTQKFLLKKRSFQSSPKSCKIFGLLLQENLSPSMAQKYPNLVSLIVTLIVKKPNSG